MKWLKNLGIDILIFAIAFFGSELLVRLDMFGGINIFMEFILFLVIYVIAYIIVKFIWSYANKQQ